MGERDFRPKAEKKAAIVELRKLKKWERRKLLSEKAEEAKGNNPDAVKT